MTTEQRKPRRAVQIRVTMDLLTELLRLPKNQRVSAVIPMDGADILHGTVRFIVDGDEFPEVPEGADPPLENLRLWHG